MQYGFKGFGERAETLTPSIQIILNGSNLDNALTTDGFSFRTKTVEGRGKTDYKVDSSDIFGMHGTALDNATLTARTIIVKARVVADDNEAYRRGMERLNHRGYARKVHDLKFTDDNDYTWYATLQGIADEDESSNKQNVELSFICTDPYKYTDTKEITTTNGSAISVDSFKPVVPEEIELTFSSASQAREWTITNTRDSYRIVYEQEGTASGTTIRIRQKEDYIGYTDSVNHLSGLNVRYSFFDEFTVGNGDRISVSPEPTSIKIKYKGVRL